MIGVKVTTTASPSTGGSATITPGTYFVPGLAQRGPADSAVLVRSYNEFLAAFGPRPAYGALHDDLQTYFAEAAGAGRAYVARVVGAAATVGTVTLADRAGTPKSTLTVTAANPGQWSSSVKVIVSDSPIVANTFDLTVTYADSVVEVYPTLATPAAAVLATKNSTYIKVANAASSSAAPANNPAAGTFVLTAGNDDRAAVTAADLVAALAKFKKEYGPGAVAVPGQPYSTVAAGLQAHVTATGRLAFLTTAVGTSLAAAQAAARSLRSSTGAERTGLVYPWVTIADSGEVRTITPTGFAAGVRARTIAQFGTWRAPAGENGVAKFVSGTELDLTGTSLTGDDLDSLTDDSIIPIKSGGVTTRLYGWRSLSLDPAWKFLSYADLLNDLAAKINARLERFAFATIDGAGHLFGAIANEVADVLVPYASSGGLYALTDESGTPIDPGYVVDLGPAYNSASTIAEGRINVYVAVRPSPVSELISVQLNKIPLTQEL